MGAVEAARKLRASSPFNFMWVDAVCHAEFAASLDVQQENLPTLAVVSPKKLRAARSIGTWSESNLVSHLDGVLGGRVGTAQFSEAAALSSQDCGALHKELNAAADSAAD